METIVNSTFAVPHRTFHEDSASISKFRLQKNCKFVVEKNSFGFKQKELSYIYQDLYEIGEWITPSPQLSGLYQELAIPRIENLRRVIKSLKRKNLQILEIGGGNSLIAEQIAQEFEDVTIICLDPAHETRFVNNNVHLISGFFPEQSPKHKFDLIYSFNTLEHVPDLNLFLNKARDFLHETGLLMLSIPECSKQIANGDWNLFSQQHVNYFVSPFFFDFIENFGFRILDYQVQFDESITTFVADSKLSNRKALFRDFILGSSQCEIDSRFISTFNKVAHILDTNKKNLNNFYVHGATAGIMNIISNLEDANHYWNNLQIVDNDPIKQGKYLSGFQKKIISIHEIQDQPATVLVASGTFVHEITKSWLSKYPNPNINFYSI